MERTLRWGNHWRVLVDVTTVIWLAVFFSSFSSRSPLDQSTADRIGLTLLAVFVADVGVVYYQANMGPSLFLRRHWVSVVMVIPYFRIFRVLRVVRFLRVLRLVQQPRPAVVMRVAKLGLNANRARK